MNAKEAARYIDISAVRSQHTSRDILEMADIAKQYGFINVHTLPCWTAYVSSLIADRPDIYTGAPVGFPGGGHKTETKLLEAEQLIADGVDEMDIVMNIGKFKDGRDEDVLEEIKRIIAITPDRILTKVIVEMNVLNDEELDRVCALVIRSGADFIKTGTGWVPGPVDISRIQRVKERTHGKIKTKAAGGVRTRDEFDALLAIGVERFGINIKSAVEIVKTFDS